MNVFLEQFYVHTIFSIPLVSGFKLDFTNSALCMVIATISVIVLLGLSIRSEELVPGKTQAFGEVVFEFVNNIIITTAGPEGTKLLPFMMTVFTFILGSNFVGMIPHSLSPTSHISVTFGVSATVVVFLTAYGLYKKGWGYLSVLLPHGVPMWLAPLMVVIESVTYIGRSVSLSLRLATNITVGHIILEAIAIIGSQLAHTGLLFIPIIFISGVTAFEFFVAILQSYIFLTLSCVYLSDTFRKH